MTSGQTKSVEILLQVLSNQDQKGIPPYIYHSRQFIQQQTQHSLMQFPLTSHQA